ncbi:hypothetical protein IF2G_04286 [Cordyceps javanica]|nr:hypothetical protein IF2G_04286 [Cordyceps javanica]
MARKGTTTTNGIQLISGKEIYVTRKGEKEAKTTNHQTQHIGQPERFEGVTPSTCSICAYRQLVATQAAEPKGNRSDGKGQSLQATCQAKDHKPSNQSSGEQTADRACRGSLLAWADQTPPLCPSPRYSLLGSLSACLPW